MNIKKTKSLSARLADATTRRTGKHGSALLFATILMFVIISVVISLSSLTVYEQKIANKNKSSVGAFFNAETGVEWAMNQVGSFTGSANNTISDVFGDAALNADGVGADSGKMNPFPGMTGYELYLLDKNGAIIPKAQFGAVNSADLVKAVRSVGINSIGEPTQRAIEAAVAAGGYSYTYYCYTDTAKGDPDCPASVVVGTQGPCDVGFKVSRDIGDVGLCCGSGCTTFYLKMPGTSCGAGYVASGTFTHAYVCSN